MKIAIVCSCRDECDVAEIHARHHARLADVLCYCDDSRDSTPEVFRRLQAEGLPLHTWPSGEGTFGYRQAVVMRQNMVRTLAEHDPDYLIPIDQDEFIQTRDRAELETALATIPAGMCGWWPLETYVPLCGGWPLPRPFDVFRRRVPEGGEMPKTVLTKELVAAGACTSVGAHCVGYPGGRAVFGHRLPIRLAHIPVRSSAQTVARVITTCPKVWGPGQNEQAGGYYVDQWLRDRGFAVSDPDLLHLGMTRVCPAPEKPTGTDEHPLAAGDIEVQWPDLARVNTVAVVERLVEDLAREVHRLRGGS